MFVGSCCLLATLGNAQVERQQCLTFLLQVAKDGPEAYQVKHSGQDYLARAKPPAQGAHLNFELLATSPAVLQSLKGLQGCRITSPAALERFGVRSPGDTLKHGTCLQGRTRKPKDYLPTWRCPSCSRLGRVEEVHSSRRWCL